MKSFFDSPESVEALGRIARAWLGTPFMPNAAVQGYGVSCQKLVGRIYIEAGLLRHDFPIPEGPMNWAHANQTSLIGEFMDRHPLFSEVTDHANALPGDMLGFKIGGCLHHCGILTAADGKFIHCLRGIGVRENNVLDATYLVRLKKVWRPISRREAILDAVFTPL